MACAVVLNHIAYVFCGFVEYRCFARVERLAMEGNGRTTYDKAWQIVLWDEKILSCLFNPAAVAINSIEIAILGGTRNFHK